MSQPDWIKQLEKAVGEIPGQARGLPSLRGPLTNHAAADIRTVCCVCGTHVSGDPKAALVSHGYCQPCGKKALSDMARKKANPQLQLLMNPDEDMRELERAPAEGDAFAAAKLARMRERITPGPMSGLNTDEQIVLLATLAWKPSYEELGKATRFVYATRDTGITPARWFAAKASLQTKKVLNKAGAAAPGARERFGIKFSGGMITELGRSLGVEYSALRHGPLYRWKGDAKQAFDAYEASLPKLNGHLAKACYNCGHELSPDQDVCPVCWAGQTDENPCHRRNPAEALTGSEQRSLNAGYKKFHGVDGSKSQSWGCPGEKNYKIWLCGRVPGVSWGHGLNESCSGCREQKMTVEGHTHEWTGHRLVFSGEARPYLCVDLESRELVLVKGDLGRLGRQELGPAPLIEYVAPKGSAKGPYHYVHATKLGFEPSLVVDQDLGGYRYVGGVYSVEDWLHD